MGIFSHFKFKDKEELVLVFDIGSSSVGGALFWTQRSGAPKIVFAIREPITLQESFNLDLFLPSTLKSLEVVAGKIFKAGLGAPAKIFCVLSSPWYISQNRIINFSKNTPFVFTPKFADSLMQKEVTLFKEEYLAKYANTQNALRLIELKNIKTMLNGYETPEPLNQEAKELEMSIFISMSPEQVLNKIEETIRKYFHFKNIQFSSFVLSSFAVVRDLHTDNENFLLTEIGGEMTDISMIKKNVLRELSSFPLGRNFIIRGVATALDSSLDEAKSFINLFQNGHATISVIEKLGPIVNKLQMEWLKKFQESLGNLSTDISVPATIFMVVDKDLADFFRKTIEIEQFNQYTLTESKFKVVFLSTEIFHSLAFFEEGTIRDSGLIIDSIYINRFLISPVRAE